MADTPSAARVSERVYPLELDAAEVTSVLHARAVVAWQHSQRSLCLPDDPGADFQRSSFNRSYRMALRDILNSQDSRS